ncbi:glycerophosphoryl diester phosphodiesterase [Friedmanniella luteola]|uniref:Glycerophosphoryl diester phosphodiesterase n=1 Tax=Friedmanniella luteola TaxID=546871 RepID=A0A1H1L2U8_9ACTN|nr:glycerophosphodiester phosphodiesterase family protein [Friedmanniella luteola]SDR68650.1 glycerophosphoryl diester phosphodiesterase [Friedmanniella luteola]
MSAIFAHRGWSARHPEMTRAAYQAAIGWAATTGAELGLECDVQFSADDQLVCLHDEDLRRTAGLPDRPVDLTVAELKRLDFGSWVRVSPEPEERELVTLAELLTMTAEARAAGAAVTLAIETKHPNPRALDVEDRLAAMLADRGWDGPDAPVRLITFDLDSLERLGRLLPGVPRTLLVHRDLTPWWDCALPDVTVVGVDLTLLRRDPGFVEHLLSQGREVHAFTVNHPDDVRFLRDLGVSGFTTDCPPEVHAVLDEPLRPSAAA